MLEIVPQVLTLQLVWSQDVTGEEIGDALGHVQENLDIVSMYEMIGVSGGSGGWWPLTLCSRSKRGWHDGTGTAQLA